MKSGKKQIMEGIDLPKKKKGSEHLKKRKVTSTREYWEYWKWTPSNKWRWKKNYARVPQSNEKTSLYKLCGRNFFKGMIFLVRCLGPLLKWTRRKKDTWTKRQNWWLCTRPFIGVMVLTYFTQQEKKEEDDSPALTIAKMLSIR